MRRADLAELARSAVEDLLECFDDGALPPRGRLRRGWLAALRSARRRLEVRDA